MGRPRKSIPDLCTHKASGRAYATDPATHLPVYFGAAGTPEAQVAYETWVQRLLARRAEVASGAPPGSSVTVARLVLDYLAHADGYYRKHGKRTSEYHSLEQACRPLVTLFGTQPAASLSTTDLKAARQQMVTAGWAREHVNEQVSRIKRVYKWGVEQQLLSATVLLALQAVAPLRKGRTPAPETEEIPPVPRDLVWRTLPHLSSLHRALVLVHWHTGMRAEDAVLLRPCDLMPDPQDSGLVLYTPWTHKTEHLGHEHTIWFNALAQEAIASLLASAAPEAWLFPSRGRGANFRYRGHLTVSGYGQAIGKACQKGQLPHWYPLQIRHSVLSLVRARFGLEGAQVIGGHKHAQVTEIYTARDRKLARKIASEMGQDKVAEDPRS